MADLGRTRRARGADGAGNALEVEAHSHRGAVRIPGNDRQQAGQAILRMTGQLGAVHGEHGRPQTVALSPQPSDGLRAVGTAQLIGSREANRPCDVLGPGPAMALLGATLLLGKDVRAVPDV